MDFTRDTVSVKKDRTTVVRRKTTKKGKDGVEYPVIQQVVYQPDGTTLISHIGDTEGFDNDPGGFNEQPPIVYDRNDTWSDEAVAINKEYEKDLNKADKLIVHNLNNKDVVAAERVGTGVYTTKEYGDPKGNYYYKETREQTEPATPIISITTDPTIIKEVAAEIAEKKTQPKAPDYKASKEKAAAEEAKRKEAYQVEQDKKNGAYAKQTSQVPMRKININGVVGEYPADWSVSEAMAYERSGSVPAGKSSPDGTPATGGESDQDVDSSSKPNTTEEELSPEERAMEEAYNKKAAAIENSYDQKSKAAEDNFNKAQEAADSVVSANDLVNSVKNSDTASQAAVDARRSSDPADDTEPADMSPEEALLALQSMKNYESQYGSDGLAKVQQQNAINKSVERGAELDAGTLPSGSSVKQGPTSRKDLKKANEANKSAVSEKVEIYPTVAGGTPQTPPIAPDKRAADFYRNGKETLEEPGYEIAPREFIPIDMKNTSSSLRVYGKGRGNGQKLGPVRDLIPAYSKFIIEGVSENRSERSQIIETFGDFYVFMFGERPTVMNFNCQLINGANINWVHDFMFMYDSYLRGTRCVEQNASCIVTYGGKQVSGLILNCSAQINAAIEGAVAMSFSLVVFERNYFYYSPDLGVYTNSNGLLETDARLTKTLATIANPEGSGMAARNASIANKFVQRAMQGSPSKGPVSFPA